MRTTNHAAVVHAFDRPPRYEPWDDPEGECVVDVLAAGLHPRVRSSADGSHYTSEGMLPMVPGIDGVGRDADGQLRYFVLPDSGAMAGRVAIDPRRSVVLPAGADPILIAAGMNPGMSSWVALRRRIDMRPGARVLVLGAGGNAGRLALEIAAHLGAGEVIGAARRGAAITLDEVGDTEPDIVLDYLWGEPAAQAMRALVTGRADRSRALDWIQIGSVAGADITLPSAALRAANLRIMGSGQGSVTTRAIVEELPARPAALPSFTVDAEAVPLQDVERAWTTPSAKRVVLVP